MSLRTGQVRAAPLHRTRRRERDYPAAAVQALACPHCAAELACADAEFRCPGGHVFDIAKQGYVALLGARARTDTGDSLDMVTARTDFLRSGHFAPIVSAVAMAVARREGPAGAPVLDLGAGTGHYLNAALDRSGGSCGIAIDSSKYAARRSAADVRVVSVLADAWSALPIRDGSIRAVLSVFAPREETEIHRMLAPAGLLIAVTPEPGHLMQLRKMVPMVTVDQGKADRLRDAFAGLLAPISRDLLEFEMTLDHADISAVVRMGPSARHLGSTELADRMRQLPPTMTVAAAVVVSVFERVSEPGGTTVRRPG